ncbi:MAG: type II toxin-antitoxin system PemK/MazF family toxin [Tepidiformaceae bacterium]
MAVAVARFEVYLCNLDPAVGSEIRKSRPCVVISPDEMNRHLRTVIVAPMTTKSKDYPTRVACDFAGTAGFVALDQLRTLDRTRLARRLGKLAAKDAEGVLGTLLALFAP